MAGGGSALLEVFWLLDAGFWLRFLQANPCMGLLVAERFFCKPSICLRNQSS